MQIDMEKAGENAGYALLRNSVVPRPIALITTVNAKGVINAAPFSFFGVVCPDPPIVGVSIGRRGGEKKDTQVNIESSGEFVVNLVSEEMTQAMNMAGMDFPPEESEMGPAGFTALPGIKVRAPRVAQAAVSLECRLRDVLEFGHGEHAHAFVMGEVLLFHVRDDLWVDGRIDCLGLKALSRLGDNYYSPLREVFELKRLRYSDWKAGK